MWRLSAGLSQTSRPRTRTVPWLGRSCPVASCRSVDLPAPLGPSRPVTPAGMCSVSLFSPMTFPYHLETPSNAMIGVISFFHHETHERHEIKELRVFLASHFVSFVCFVV